jgi:hypothetical protein
VASPGCYPPISAPSRLEKLAASLPQPGRLWSAARGVGDLNAAFSSSIGAMYGAKHGWGGVGPARCHRACEYTGSEVKVVLSGAGL